ncbi:MAG: hypothetical protein ACKVP4_12200 [Hyphomicrobium sp.]
MMAVARDNDELLLVKVLSGEACSNFVDGNDRDVYSAHLGIFKCGLPGTLKWHTAMWRKNLANFNFGIRRFDDAHSLAVQRLSSAL